MVTVPSSPDLAMGDVEIRPCFARGAGSPPQVVTPRGETTASTSSPDILSGGRHRVQRLRQDPSAGEGKGARRRERDVWRVHGRPRSGRLCTHQTILAVLRFGRGDRKRPTLAGLCVPFCASLMKVTRCITKLVADRLQASFMLHKGADPAIRYAPI